MRAGRLLSYAPSRTGVPRRGSRARAILAGAAVVAGAATLTALHMLPASRGLDPMSEPLSQYAFAPDGWLFDLAVLILALGVAVLASALVKGRCLASRSPARALLTTCSLSMVVLVVFPDHESNGAVRTAGQIHWVAAMLAFGGLSLAPTMLGHHRASGCSRLTSLARWLSAGIAPCFLVVLTASLLRYRTRLPVPAWSVGLTERVLVASEFVLAGLLTAWAWRGCTCSLGDLVARSSALSGSTGGSAERDDEQAATAAVSQLEVVSAHRDGP